jgi:hypothetical protein
MTDLLSTIRAEIDARMRELAPLVAEYERLSSASDALEAEARSAPSPPAVSGRPPRASTTKASTTKASAETAARKTTARRGRRRERSAPSPTGQSVLAALEHGSHTVAELVVVTALPAGDIRDSLRDLRRRKAVVKTDRDGRAAYALGAASGE